MEAARLVDWIGDLPRGRSAIRCCRACGPAPSATRCRRPRPRPPSRSAASSTTWRRPSCPGSRTGTTPASSPTSPSPPPRPGILGEMLAAALNVNGMLWKTSPAATEMELTVLDWLRQMLGLPAGCSASSRTPPPPPRWWPWPRRARPCPGSTRAAGAGRAGAAAHVRFDGGALLGREGGHRPRHRPGRAAARSPPTPSSAWTWRRCDGAIAEDRAAGLHPVRGDRHRGHHLHHQHRPRPRSRSLRARGPVAARRTPPTAARRRSIPACGTSSTAASGRTRWW